MEKTVYFEFDNNVKIEKIKSDVIYYHSKKDGCKYESTSILTCPCDDKKPQGLQRGMALLSKI